MVVAVVVVVVEVVSVVVVAGDVDTVFIPVVEVRPMERVNKF